MRAYVTEAAPDKLVCHFWPLSCTVLEEQPAVMLQMRGRRIDDRAQAGHRIRAGRQRSPRLMLHSRILQSAIVLCNVRRIAQDEVECASGERREPASVEEFDASEAERRSVGTRH